MNKPPVLDQLAKLAVLTEIEFMEPEALRRTLQVVMDLRELRNQMEAACREADDEGDFYSGGNISTHEIYGWIQCLGRDS